MPQDMLKDWQYFLIANGNCNNISLNLNLSRNSTDNQIYVGTIGAGKTKTVSVPVTVSSFFRLDSVDM